MSPLNKLKGIIFDLDGTLADTLPLCIAAFRQSVEPLISRPVSDEEIIATFGPSEEGTIMALAPQHYDNGVTSYLQHYQTLHDMCPDVFEGIRELLTLLQRSGIRIAMVTGKGHKSTVISLEKFGIHSCFEHIETGSPHGPRKADGIRAVLARWPDLSNDQVLYVGDAPGDIEASRAAGIPVAAAAWAGTADPQKLRSLHPDLLFYSIHDFSTWLHTII